MNTGDTLAALINTLFVPVISAKIHTDRIVQEDVTDRFAFIVRYLIYAPFNFILTRLINKAGMVLFGIEDTLSWYPRYTIYAVVSAVVLPYLYELIVRRFSVEIKEK